MIKKISFLSIILIGLFALSACSSSYTITFESNGGTEVRSISVKEGESISIPSIIREGYTLEGWYTSINGGVTLDERWSFSNDIVNSDITLYAKWNINQYTISFNSQEGSAVSSMTQDYATAVSEPSEPIRTGYTFNGWYVDEDFTETYAFKTMPAEDIIVYAKWTINQYSITFNSNGGSVTDSITQDYATSVLEPTEPTREGYNFEGWYSNSTLITPYTFTTMPAKDINLYGKWDAIDYAITYNLNGGTNGSNPASYTVEAATITLAEATKEGYTFNGWYDNAEFTGDIFTEITIGSNGDVTLYASWTINQYEISYNISYVDQIGNVTLNLGETIINISLGRYHSSAITSTGRVFTWGYNKYGRLGDGTTIDRTTPTDITSRFNLGDGETIISISLGDYHSSAITSTGRVFTWGYNTYGQLGDGTTIDKSTPTEITTYATTLIHQETYDYALETTEYIPTLEGYIFSGWYSDINFTIPYTFTTMPAEDLILYGQWIPKQ